MVTQKPKVQKLTHGTSAQAVLPKTTAKPFWRKITLAQIAAMLMIMMAAVLFMDLGRRAAANYRVQREAEELKQQVELARQHRTELLARRSYVASDLFVEEVARKELKWAKAGETVVVIMPNQAAEPLPPQATPAAIEVAAAPPPSSWWVLLFGTATPSDPLE